MIDKSVDFFKIYSIVNQLRSNGVMVMSGMDPPLQLPFCYYVLLLTIQIYILQLLLVFPMVEIEKSASLFHNKMI